MNKPLGPLPDSADPPALLELALAVALEAGALARRTRASGRRAAESGAVTKSSASDLATDADRANEQLIRRRLAAARPHDAVLGEEGGALAGTSGLVWVIDPIDGTTNFVYDYPSYAVSVAVAEEQGARGAGGPWPEALGSLLGVGRILAGVVHDPVRDETFTASLGGGARLNGVPLEVDAGPAELATCLIGTGFAYSRADRVVQARLLEAVLPAVRDLRRGGAASLDVCQVAAGRVDGFYESELNSWDVAAGMLVAREAGAFVDVLGALPPGPTVLVARPEVAPQLEAVLWRAAARLGETSQDRHRDGDHARDRDRDRDRDRGDERNEAR